jgi:putative YphP/YqiW family bacilliredoxin
MPYPEEFIAPMRAELANAGVRELRSSSDVENVLASSGTVMIVVNSICGCAAGKARPGIVMALQHERTPDVVATVFAGADMDATARAREAFLP